MENLKSNDKTTNYLKDFIGDPLILIDVGCSGGIHKAWEAFGNKITGIGFDPVVDEIKRLREQTHPQFEYIEGFVTSPKITVPPITFWQRLAVHETTQIINKKNRFNPIEMLGRNHWNKLKLSEKKIVLSEYLEERGLIPNFIKIDVDGDDFSILQSLEKILSNPKLFGIGIEVNYCGTEAENQNTFHNVDRFLRGYKFDLYDLTVRKYSMSALPAPYSITIPAQSERGRPLQGDALYLKDPILTSDDNETTLDDILQMACLFSIFDQKDSCAELLLKHKNVLPEAIDLNLVLDQLVKDMNISEFDQLSYKELIKKFNKNDAVFYPSTTQVLKEGFSQKLKNYLK